MILEKFPTIRQVAEEIRQKSITNFRYPYEINLVHQASSLVKKPITFEEDQDIIFMGEIHQAKISDREIFRIKIHKDIPSEERMSTIGHEIGHFIVAYHNLLYTKNNDSELFLFFNRLSNPRTGKWFSRAWYQKWNKKSYNPKSGVAKVTECLCEELGSFFNVGMLERNKLENKRRSSQLAFDF